MRKRVALVTSGLGTAYGGIGVVAKAIKSALDPYCRVSVWQHPPFWPRPLRVAKVAAHLFLGSQTPPDFVIYDHVHLAVRHEDDLVGGLAGLHDHLAGIDPALPEAGGQLLQRDLRPCPPCRTACHDSQATQPALCGLHPWCRGLAGPIKP